MRTSQALTLVQNFSNTSTKSGPRTNWPAYAGEEFIIHRDQMIQLAKTYTVAPTIFLPEFPSKQKQLTHQKLIKLCNALSYIEEHIQPQDFPHLFKQDQIRQNTINLWKETWESELKMTYAAAGIFTADEISGIEPSAPIECRRLSDAAVIQCKKTCADLLAELSALIVRDYADCQPTPPMAYLPARRIE